MARSRRLRLTDRPGKFVQPIEALFTSFSEKVMKLHLGLALAGVLGVGTWGGPTRAAQKTVNDTDFLVENVTRAACEVSASRRALTRATAEAVREFARKVIAQQGAFDAAL